MAKNTFIVRRGDITKIVEVNDLTNDELAALVYDNNYQTKDIDEEVDGFRILITAPGEKLTYFPKGLALQSENLIFYLSINPDMASISARLRIASGSGSGNYKLQARGNNLGAAWTDLATINAAGTTGEFDLATVDIDTANLQHGKTYAFRVKDSGTGFECQQQLFTIPAAPNATIEAVFAGTGLVDIVDNGGGALDINFAINPDNINLPAGVGIAGYDRKVSFWHLLAQNPIDDTAGLTVDSNVSVSGNFDGVYVITQQFNMSNGKVFQLARVIGIDGTGAIIRDIQMNGCEITNISGLDMDINVQMVQMGGLEPVNILAAGATLPEGGVLIGDEVDPNTTVPVTVPAGTEIIAVAPDAMNESFIISHFDHDFFPYFSVATTA
ncbi:MAG: hypothetical protein JSS76_08450 [Bacteroidetes bacterium]|nr:hypothetical protein [Bacteroidota bacterium]